MSNAIKVLSIFLFDLLLIYWGAMLSIFCVGGYFSWYQIEQWAFFKGPTFYKLGVVVLWWVLWIPKLYISQKKIFGCKIQCRRTRFMRNKVTIRKHKTNKPNLLHSKHVYFPILTPPSSLKTLYFSLSSQTKISFNCCCKRQSYLKSGTYLLVFCKGKIKFF